VTSPSPKARDSGRPADVPLVLIVDDNEKNRKLARDVLRAAGLQTIEAASGGEAIAVAAECLPDVILLDLRLPDMDGTDIACTLRDRVQTARIPVVALSALRYAGDSDQLLAAGFSGYLEKPIDVRAFPEQVRSYCGHANA
jgi:two-component system, cell cycle response regulator DivK